MEALGRVTLFLLLILGGLAVAFLGAYVILSIAVTYGIGFITQFTFVQIYGVLTIISLICSGTTANKESTENKKFEDSMIQGFSTLFGKAVGYLLIWGFATWIYSVMV